MHDDGRDGRAFRPANRRQAAVAQVLVFLATLAALELATNTLSITFLGNVAAIISNPLDKLGASQLSDEWSAEAMLARNASSMLEFPETMWPRRCGQSCCPFNVSIYVYEDLPLTLTGAFEDRILAMVKNHTRISENVATEMALLQLFRTSPCRINNPRDADLYVVPYMHFSHCCFQEGHAYGCGQVPDSDMNALFNSLEYYNRTTKNRHIFVSVFDALMTKKQMRMEHTYLKLTSGPILPGVDPSGSIVLPIIHDSPSYQPSILMKRNESWWTRPRKYAFVAFFGGLNPRMRRRQPRRFRTYFFNSVKKYYPKTLGGLDYVAVTISGEQAIDYTAAYRDAVLCPILAGDTCWQRRFFDVIRNGCLPLVLEWPLQSGIGERTWHQPDSCSTLQTYPFIKGMFWNDKSIEIDYDSFVVRAPANLEDDTNMSSILTVMQEILADPVELSRRQRNMMAVVQHLTFGLGMDAHVYDDAFSRVMKILQHHVLFTSDLAIT